MRRLALFLVFLLLFGLGLFVLFWLDQRARAPERHEPTAATQPPPLPAPEESQGFQLSGPSQLVIYDKATKRPSLRVESRDTTREGDFYVLAGATAELFDPAVERGVQVRLQAERARAKVIPDEDALRPRWEDYYELENVHGEALSGTSLAPLTFDTPHAVLDNRDTTARLLSGAEPFTSRSSAFTATGRGFEWAVDQDLLTIPHEGRVELHQAGPRSGGVSAALSSSGEGALVVRRTADGPVTLEAWKGAALEPGATNPGRLTAEHMLLRARAAAGAEDELALERLDADGAVDWTSGEAHFRGQRLNASFADDGRLERARLDGEPTAEVMLALAGVSAAGESAKRKIVLAGQDALDIVWKEGGYGLRAEAAREPSAGRVPTVVSEDFRLETASTIDGWLAEDQRSARFKASGGVIVTSGESRLETAQFEVGIGPDERGESVLKGRAQGGASLIGKLPLEPGDPGPARTFTLTSPDGLELERDAGGWRVIEGTRVELSLDGPQGFRARADRIHDFVVPRTGSGELAPAGLRFLAEGDVQVDSALGHLAGEELEVQGVAPVPHFVLRGTKSAKALFQGEVGEGRALEVERTGDTLYARGEVSGSAELGSPRGPVHLTFAGDSLTLDRSESGELLPGERLRILRVVVEGHTNGSVTARGQTVVFRSERFSGESRVRLRANDERAELGSLFIAEGAVHADFADPDSDLAIDCERFEVERGSGEEADGFRQLTANGDVRFQGRFGGREDIDVGGECEAFVFGADRRGSLDAGSHGRVALLGRVPERQTPFRLTADHVDFELLGDDSLRLFALRPELRMLGLRARAEHFTADELEGVVLSGAARVSGATTAQVPFTLDAEEIVLVGRRPPPGESGPTDPEQRTSLEDQLDSLQARGKVDFSLSDSVRARGERLAVRRATGLLRLEGAPATFDLGGARLETEWVEFDPVLQLLVGTGRGRMLTLAEGTAQADASSWTLDFLSISSLLERDSVILAVQEPLFRSSTSRSALRASWGVLWLNREALESLDRRDELLGGLQLILERMRSVPKDAGLAEIMALFGSAELSGLLREVFFEGPVEVLSEGDLLARADAIYVDTASQHGWLAGATVNLGRQFLGQRQEKLIIKADWLRLSSDASLRADHATVTPCGFDDPHVVVVTGNLKIKPTSKPGKARYELVLKDNGVELYDFLRIPLPTIDVSADEDFKPVWPTLSLANSARFGTLLSFAFTRPAEPIGRLFDRIVHPFASSGQGEAAGAPAPDGSGAPPAPKKERSDVDANYKVDASYLHSRGALLDLGLEIEAKNEYWFDLYLGLAFDSGEDKGFIRDENAVRDHLRRWLRSQAYFDRGKSAWTLSYSNQSDAAVQSEFYESRFLRYERSEDYVQWRRSSDEYFTQATVKLRLEEFRSDVEELPAVSGYRGRAPILRIGALSLLHTGDVRAEFLRRRAGTDPHSPFEFGPTFDDASRDAFGPLDGLGEREFLRFDTSQQLELPVPLGAGVRLTPFVGGRATGWSEGVDENDSPSRFVAEGGARLGASFWKRGGRGWLYQLAPFVEYRNELERRDEHGEPVTIDATERLVTADAVRVGSRARFGSRETGTLLDLDLVSGYASNRSDGAPSDWLPLEVFAGLTTETHGREFEVFHEGRYDLATHQTEYSLVSMGVHFGEQWGLQFSHQRGRNAADQALFEAASVSGLYRWTEKWEFELREFFSLLENQQLGTRGTVRRYGHDLVFELDLESREGEGSSVGFNVKPRFGFRPPRVGYVPW